MKDAIKVMAIHRNLRKYAVLLSKAYRTPWIVEDSDHLSKQA